MKKTLYITALLFAAGTSNAGDRLGSGELKNLFTGKTITGTHFKNGSQKTYYDHDGSVRSKSTSGTERTGKWWIDENANKRCVKWDDGNKDLCHYVERNGDGSHTLIHGKNGKKLVDIQSSQDGNQL